MVYIRKKINDKYYYYKDKKRIKSKKIIEKLSKIYIAPSYTDVKIYLGTKLLATGIDSKGRKQYIYNKSYKNKMSEYKYCNLINYGLHKKEIDINLIKNIKNYKINKKLSLIALIIFIMNLCNFRVGNKINEKKYKSTGLTTLKKKQIKINGNNILIDFIGKKQVRNICDVNIENKEIIKILKNLYKNSNNKSEYIFKFKENKKIIKINETDINKYLKNYNKNITSKDIRTWNANIILLKNVKLSDNITERKKILKEAIKITSMKLNNTPTVCKSNYILNEILNIYINDYNLFKKIYNDKKVEKTLVKILYNFCKNI